MKPSNSRWSLRDRPPHVVFFFALPLRLDDKRLRVISNQFSCFVLQCNRVNREISHTLGCALAGLRTLLRTWIHVSSSRRKESTRKCEQVFSIEVVAVSWSRLTRALFIHERYLNEREAIDGKGCPKCGFAIDANCYMNAGCARAAWYGTQSGLAFLRRQRPLLRLKTCHEVVYIATALRARDTMVVNQRPKTRSHVLTFWIETGLPDPAATVCQPEIPHPEIVSSSATIHNKAQRFEIRC